MSTVIFDKVVSLCKRRGFFYPTCDIYGGINGVYDYGPLACVLERNLINLWIKHMKLSNFNMIQMNGSILGNSSMWKASGHVNGFSDPLIDCKSCKVRYRTDDISVDKPCQRCGIKNWSESRQFNMMFSTILGPVADSGSIAYLRPETAQSIFVQFKNIYNTNRVKIPFGIMQIGKSFRNEITPKQFLFRLREFTQMEMEFFCKEEDAKEFFSYWVNRRKNFYSFIGIKEENIKIREHEKDELSHYSSSTSDIEYKFPFGYKELEGIAYRSNFDLLSHSKASTKDLSINDPISNTSYIPHVVETSVGLDRLILSVLCDSYCEDIVDESERVYLNLNINLAPIKIAVFPLTKNEEELTKKIYLILLENFNDVIYDDSGSIGKRYRRQDEIGTPFCITIDSNSASSGSITLRHRNSTKQEIVSINNMLILLNNNFNVK